MPENRAIWGDGLACVYCLTNRSLPGLVKIGHTAGSAKQRAAQISAATGVPEPFEVAWSVSVADGRAAEKAIHDALARYRYARTREFFAMSPEMARAGVTEILEVHDFQQRDDKFLESLAAPSRQPARSFLARLFGR